MKESPLWRLDETKTKDEKETKLSTRLNQCLTSLQDLSKGKDDFLKENNQIQETDSFTNHVQCSKKRKLSSDENILQPKKKIIQKQAKHTVIKNPISLNDLGSAKFMESYFKIKPEHSFFAGKKEDLEKNLIFSSERKFKDKEEGKPWKIFRKGTIIYYCETYDEYYALDVMSGKIVGEASLSDDWLRNIEVNKDFRRKGIGTNLIKAIVKMMGKKFLIPTGGTLESSYYLTEEGAVLINHCLKKNIISEEQCMADVPNRTPTSSARILTRVLCSIEDVPESQ